MRLFFYGLLATTLTLAGLHYGLPTDGISRPSNAKEFAATAVKIMRIDNRSGGTGVILKSEPGNSTILTNHHICELLTKGGWAYQERVKYAVTGYKFSSNHDLCLVKVNADLGVNTKLASREPEKYSPATISGYPNLYPHVTSHGYFSGHYTIRLAQGLRACTPDDVQYAIQYRDVELLMTCAIFKTVPTLGDKIDTTLVTGLVTHGSSGSAVFDQNGEIGAVIFAVQGEGLGYGFAVPYKYVKKFLEQEVPNMNWTVPTK